ncbi:MAG: class I SAM-dependent methyltransferase [Anaerolineales bacterium]|nr:class I SAM-dependent methyltransferase [Anaerolineales bacterium]
MQTLMCNLCHSNDFELLYKLPDLLLQREQVISTFVRCKQCGLVLQNPRPNIEEMSFHYPPEYDSYTTALNNNQTPWLLQKAYRYGIEKRGRIVRNHKKSGRLLDIGCATGVFLAGMKVHPEWELIGVEINKQAAEIAREQNQLNVVHGTLEDAGFPSEFFDAVTMWDVLEHLHDPSSSLKEIHRILKPDGVLVFRVPNLNSWDAKLFGAAWAGLDAPRHLYVFDPQTLSSLLAKNNFEIHKMGCNIGSYPTFLLSLRFWLLAKGIPESIRMTVLKILHHPIMRVISSPLFFVYGLGLRGPLITVVATKREVD